MKKIIKFIIFFVALGLLWHYYLPLGNFFRKHNLDLVKQFQNNQTLENISSGAGKIFEGGTLRSYEENTNSNLTVAGVIEQTNLNRKQNGNLVALKENAKLDHSAALKVKDMFSKQYFEHVSPSGKGPGDLAKQVNYQFITIGENLALGNYKDDKALVEAWMNSPGHRANILNIKFEEIGVAVSKGLYEGKETWLAVQEFGKPLSSCPKVDANLQQQIKTLNTEVDQMQAVLVNTKKQIDSSNPQSQSEYDSYNELVKKYNDLVKIYNNKVDTLKQFTIQYNLEVKAYNACA